MRSVFWKSDNGREALFDNKSVYEGGNFLTFRSLTSVLGATAETAKVPRGEGITTFYAALNNRDIHVSGSMLTLGDKTHRAREEYDRKCSWLAETFAPDVWGTLTYRREDGNVRIRCRPITIPTVSAPVGVYSTVEVDFTTDTPYWERETEEQFIMGVSMKLLHFPWTPHRSPMGVFCHYAQIENPTTRIIYPTMEVHTAGNSVTFKNLTAGKEFTIEHTVADGQVLRIDMRDITAVLDETEDVSHWLSVDSEPWGLVPGLNQLEVLNNNPEDTPVTYIKWHIPVLGV